MASKLSRALGTKITIDSSNIPDDVVIQSDIGPSSIGNTEMADNAIDSAELVDGSVDLAHMSDESVDSDQYVDASIDVAHMSVNSVDSDQYIDGSVDNVHIADTTIQGGKLDVFQSAEVDGTGSNVDTAHGLGHTPTVVIVTLTQKDTTTAVQITESAHDATNVKVTCTSTAKYKIVAF